MITASPLHFIGLEDLNGEFIQGGKPVLVVYMHQNAESQKQVEIIRSIGEKYGRILKIGLVREDFLAAFSQKYRVKGSPTFLIFVKGEEKGRMLGRADQETLKDFILETLPSLQYDPMN